MAAIAAQGSQGEIRNTVTENRRASSHPKNSDSDHRIVSRRIQSLPIR